MPKEDYTLAQVPTDEGEDTVVLEEVTHLERNPDSNVRTIRSTLYQLLSSMMNLSASWLQ